MSLCEYGEGLNLMEKNIFDDTVNIGILRTISALYEAGVNDGEIVRLVKKHWELDKEYEEKIIKRLVFIKVETVLDALTLYMQCLGFSNEKIIEFMRSHNVRSKVRADSQLWKLKTKPEKLYEAVQSKK